MQHSIFIRYLKLDTSPHWMKPWKIIGASILVIFASLGALLRPYYQLEFQRKCRTENVISSLHADFTVVTPPDIETITSLESILEKRSVSSKMLDFLSQRDHIEIKNLPVLLYNIETYKPKFPDKLMVEVKFYDHGTASAYPIHKDGYFITAHHSLVGEKCVQMDDILNHI